ncbi:hypothetical protein E6H36_01015 [Candidatus Bathyarchaeota archaeon]|nr:MAG: hypothetical protein E6H36_01015 [Candidatus Bathyarchaeota archaeon]
MNFLDTTRARPRTVLGSLAGLVMVLVGSLLYASNGFYYSTVFLAGTMMIPAGLVTIGLSIAPDWND